MYMKNWFIQRKLERIGKRADPDKDFVFSLKKSLIQRAVAKSSWISSWKLAVGSITSISFILAGTGVYAYTSDDVLPDHPLYPIRETIERVEEAATFTKARNVQVKLKNLQRKIHEQELIVKKNKPVSQAQMEKFMNKIDMALDLAGKLPEKERVRADQKMIKLENEFAKGLQNSRERVKDEESRKKIDSIIDKQQKRMEARVELLEEKRKERIKQLNLREKMMDSKFNKYQKRDENAGGTIKQIEPKEGVTTSVRQLRPRLQEFLIKTALERLKSLE
jgi:hypothetical protein